MAFSEKEADVTTLQLEIKNSTAIAARWRSVRGRFHSYEHMYG